MKLLLKKYSIPFLVGLLSILVLCLFRILQNVDFLYKEIFIWLGCFFSILLIRAADDFFDYQEDEKNNLPHLSKTLVIILFILFSILPIVFFTISNIALGLIMSLINVSYIILMIARNNRVGKICIGLINFVITIFLLLNLYNNSYYLNNLITIIYALSVILIALALSIVNYIIRGKRK